MKDNLRSQKVVRIQMNSSTNSQVTQPIAQNETKNVKRTQQIKALHLQFEDLKKKIKDVESKNQKIIENIHKQYDFKKKGPQTTEYISETTPIIYYEKQQKSQLSVVDNASNKSDQSECQFRMNKHFSKKSSNSKKVIHPSFHQSVQYRRTETLEEPRQRQREHSENGSNNGNPIIKPAYYPPPPPNPYTYGQQQQYSIPPQDPFAVSQFSGLGQYQMSLQFPPYQASPNLSVSQVNSLYGQNNTNIQSIYQLQEALKRERQKIKALEKQIQEKQIEVINMKKIQKKYNNLTQNVENILQNSVEQFMEEVVKKKLYQIEKCIKKHENKLRRLQIKIRDKGEETRSNRNIEQHRQRRSHSRTKRQNSPKLATAYSSLSSAAKVPHKRSLIIPAQSNNSTSKSKKSDQNKSSKQFQQIAGKYEEMIKVKNEEIQISERKLREKDKEIADLNLKCSKLQKKLIDFQEIPKALSSRNSRKNSQRQQNLLANLDFDTQKDAKIQANLKLIGELEEQLKIKVNELREKNTNFDKLRKKLGDSDIKIKKLQGEIQNLRQESKDRKWEKYQEFENRVKKLQAEIQIKDKQQDNLKQRYMAVESQKIEIECENYSLKNRLKKIQQAIQMKQNQIVQLKSIIQSSNGENFADLLEKSMYQDRNQNCDVQVLQQENDKLEEEISKRKQQIFGLVKGKQILQNKVKELEEAFLAQKKEKQYIEIQNESMRITLKSLQFEKYGKENKSPLQKLLSDDPESKSEEQNQDEKDILKEQIEELTKKYEESQRNLKVLKNESLQSNTRVIKLNSQLSYVRQLLAQRQQKCQKFKRQFQESKIAVNQMQQLLAQKDAELQVERKINQDKIREIQSQWLEFEQQIKGRQEDIDDSHNNSDLRNSRHISDESFMNYKNTYNSVNAQNELLTQKLKEAQKIIEIQKEMEDKIILEYKGNVDKIKSELRQKGRHCDQMQEENEQFRRRIRNLQQNQLRLKRARSEQDENLLGPDDKSQKILDLEIEVNQVKDINFKLTAVQQELFKQINEKQDQNNQLHQMLRTQKQKIQELQDIIQLKDMNFSSHISSSNHKSKVRDSMKSQSSLRYSMLSNNPQKDKTMEFELSEAGESFFDQNQSMISNVSEVFGKEEFPYEKMQLKRIQQRRLFQKTASYIKSLKKAIEQKTKKIKVLEKKIQSLRNSELIRKDIYQIKQNDSDKFDDDNFRDYYSVQMQFSRSTRNKYKQLQHETKLTIEENNLLTNQIENLQQELIKAEEQENSLVKIKDLYKEEIKKLIKKNEQQAKIFEDELKKERQKVQLSQSVHNLQTLKQLFLKIMSVIVLIETEGHKSKKKQQRKKQLTGYVSIYCKHMGLDGNTQQKLIGDLRK